ncbi:flagellar basal body-associated FliL family protein [Sphingomonas sp.]|jgi:flagellar FliL protein|uniref:flagellar basal body-associated FliL family protein n=1 Tax=Sphingomonas sp. TaxID=28214 RepID=UPI002DEA4C49|nr:flagellar basal body-associated FliL family protein [Sphingomonas sp.]
MATAALPTDAPAPKKKGKKLILIIALLVLIGAGVGAGLFFTGMIGAKEEVEQKDMPKLLPKGSKPKAEGKEEGGSKEGDAPKYESSYFQLEKEFTSNLKESSHLIQIGLAVSTHYDEKVTEALKAHELAIRSAVLMAINDTDEEAIFTSEGKKDLQQRLVKAINAVLKEKEGFGGVSNVYFTNFIVQ